MSRRLFSIIGHHSNAIAPTERLPSRLSSPHSGRPDDVTVYLFPYLRSVSIFEVKNGDTFNAELYAAEDELNKEEIRCPHEAVQLSVMRKVDSAIDNNVKTQ